MLSAPWNSSPRSIAPYCFWTISTPKPMGPRPEEAAAAVTPLMRKTLLFQRAMTCLLSPPRAEAGIPSQQPRCPTRGPAPSLSVQILASTPGSCGPSATAPAQAHRCAPRQQPSPPPYGCCRPSRPVPGAPCSTRTTAGWEAQPSR